MLRKNKRRETFIIGYKVFYLHKGYFVIQLSNDDAIKHYSKMIVEWSGSHLTPAESRGKAETPQAKPRRLSFLPGASSGWSAMERTIFYLFALKSTSFENVYSII
ncbi:hypothetical protein FVO58_15265 [Metabacillus halosaccharovorans]|nr:hypothetical protein [Metabacillus halosaccharovorans]